MKGAGDRTIPPYVEQENNPYVTNAEKKAKTDAFFEKQKQVEKTKQQLGIVAPQPMVDFKFYAPPAPGKPAGPNPKNFIPIGTNSYGVQVQPNLNFPYMPDCNLPYGNVLNQVPIIKNYNITLDSLGGNHSQINAIYEDILPEKYYNNTFATVLERKNILQYIRSIFVKQYDGEDVALRGDRDNSLLKYIKFLDLNPYNPSLISDNPYRGLPDNMLIYKSCYPIRKNAMTNTVQCAARSIGLNVRIYSLTNKEYLLHKDKNSSVILYDTWRELAYYEYVREHIIKKGICPNFTIMYSYHISMNCDIDFEKVNNIKRGKLGEPQRTHKFVVRNNDGILDGFSMNKPETSLPGQPMVGAGTNTPSIKKFVQPPMPSQMLPQIPGQYTNYTTVASIGPMGPNLDSTMGLSRKTYNSCPTMIERNRDAPSKKALLLLTEAPTYNLVTWASKVYKVNGNVRQMISTGYHDTNVWLSILFQIMAGLCTLQYHGMMLNEFTILDNVYIKEVASTDNSRKYWIYNIDGIDYYIPNYGYLVLIDSNFKDVTQVSSGSILHDIKTNQVLEDIEDEPLEKRNMKVYGKIFEDDISIKNGVRVKDDTILKDASTLAFKNSFNQNVFSNVFVSSGGSRPSDEIIELLTQISTNDYSDIEDCITVQMRMFMNNRIGTLLKESEVGNVIKGRLPTVRKGMMLVHEISYDTFMFVLCLGENADGTISVIALENPNITSVDIVLSEYNLTKDVLFNYSAHDPITQNYSPYANLSSSNVLEVYRIMRQ